MQQATEIGQPAISVDANKKELVGACKNGGREWQSVGSPKTVRVHDFVDPLVGRALPHGVYDNATRSWWAALGRERYPNAHSLTITADGGGSNGSRVRLWRVELQNLADELGLTITVLHLPPGTSKWNKIEHRLFSFISRNWRGRPLLDYQTIVELTGVTTTGLTVRCEFDRTNYPAGVKMSDDAIRRRATSSCGAVSRA